MGSPESPVFPQTLMCLPGLPAGAGGGCKRLEPQAAPAIGASAGPVPGSSEDGLSGGDFDPGRGQQQQLPALVPPCRALQEQGGMSPLWPWSVEHLCTAAHAALGAKICPGHLGLLLAPRDALQPSPPAQLPPLPWPLLSNCLALPMVPMVHCRLPVSPLQVRGQAQAQLGRPLPACFIPSAVQGLLSARRGHLAQVTL